MSGGKVKPIYLRVAAKELERLLKERAHHLALMRKAAARIEALTAEQDLLRSKIREQIRLANRREA